MAKTTLTQIKLPDFSLDIEKRPITPPKLSVKDKKIMFELTKDAKIPIKKLAKKIGLSREVVTYRIERLIKIGVIQGFSAFVNISKLGLRWHYILLELQNYSTEFEETLASFVKTKPDIIKAVKYIGDYDLIIEVCSRNFTDFNKTLVEIRNVCGSHLKNYEVLLALNEYKYITSSLGHLGYKQKDLYEIKKDLEMHKIEDENFQQSEIDEKDRLIIKELVENCRIPNTTIGKKVGLSNDGVIKRVKNLVDKKIIAGFNTIFALFNINIQWYAVLLRFQNITEEREKQFIDFVITHPFLGTLTKLNGSYDYICLFYAANTKEYNEIINELRSTFSDIIGDYTSLVGLTEYKYNENPVDMI